MKRLLTFITISASLALAPSVRADEITRFLPMKAEQLNPEQKKWADLISAPPRNAKFVNPPYRAYIYNPDLANRLTAMSEYLRWNTSLPPRLSELAILITARQWTAQFNPRAITEADFVELYAAAFEPRGKGDGM